MTGTIRRKLALASLVLAGAGCAMFLRDVKPLTPAERQEAQKNYGEEVARDVETVVETTPRTYPIVELCLWPYLSATSTQKEEGARQAYQSWRSCEMGCRKAAKGGPYPELAAKYGARCKQGLAGASSEHYVQELSKKVQALRESKKPDDWLQNKTNVEEVIIDARKELGGDSPEMKPLVEEYTQLITEHRRDLERALGFYKRQDIAARRSEMSRLKLEIASLGDKRRSDSGQALMMLKQRRYDELKEEIDQEARKWGIR